MIRDYALRRLLGSLAVLTVGVGVLMAASPFQEEWEGKTVEDVRGLEPSRFRALLEKLNAKPNRPYTLAKKDEDYKVLYETRYFEDIRIDVQEGSARDKIVVVIRATEAPQLQDVQFSGLRAIPISTLRPLLRLNPGDRLNSHLLKMDRDMIREQYISKGYHFSDIREEITYTPRGAVLHWRIFEGPLVTVREIVFTGNEGFSNSRLKEIMLLKENAWFLFLPASREPFVERFLEESIKRLKLFYALEGWLDINVGERIFVEDLVFSEDKTEVTIKIHINEGRRYKIRSIDVRGNAVFTDEQILEVVKSKVGEDYSENQAGRDSAKIREKYGENAYILAEINATPRFDREKPELDLIFDVKEGPEIRIGRISVQGNYKTRIDVILRELKDFNPGDKFNSALLDRGLRRLRDRGFFDPMAGISVRTEEGDAKDVRDVILDVKEGQTGNIRFAGGYSSSFGILGIFEFTQRNFDITDLPKSFEDLFSGEAFTGGGQFFQIRLAPSARRQSFIVDFREPYTFGYDLGFGTRGYNIRTQREDWDEERLGASVSFDRRIDPFRLELRLNAFRIGVDDIESGAPSTVLSLEGENRVFSITPAIVYDTRDSQLFASEGVRISASYEYAGQILPGDFDYFKLVCDGEFLLTVFETEDKLKHVFSVNLTFGWAEEKRQSDEVPFFERFYAGGRDSIRGFEFRGIGPRENGDPVGGEAYVFGSAEYSFPLFVEFLRGAVFYDIADLTSNIDLLEHDKWRQSVGFGIRFIIPQLGNIPVALDFGFPLTKQDDDERQTVTFDIGKLF